jgi:hypothetical protein
MGQQTNISFYSEGDVVPSQDTALRALRSLGVDESLAFVTRYKTPFDGWKHRSDGSLPSWEFIRRRATLSEAIKFIRPGPEVVISVRKSDDGIARRFFIDAWQATPETLAAECIFSNNDCTFGMHDIFGIVAQAKEEDTYIARSPFSVKFWGYRCPKDIDQFREIVGNLPIVSEVAEALSQALNQPIKTAIYMNL